MAGMHGLTAGRALRVLALVLAAVLTAGVVASSQAQARAAADLVSLPAAGACTVEPRYAKHDFRAMWIASVENIDWPSRPGLSVARQQAELRGWLDLAVRLNLNAVVLQVRPAADALWPSPFEPWSRWLTGRQGGDPGYDPLGFAVAEAHQRNLALHAWFNPFRVSNSGRLKGLAPTHPARQNPDWVVRKDGRLYYDPGLPEVRSFVTDAIMDAVTRYDLDGVHFDDYFYPYPGSGAPFRDGASFAAHGAGFSTRADWRRANIDALITSLHDRIAATKPWVQFGVSPFAVWRNASTDPSGSDTRAGVETYDDLYADVRRWVREGLIDYVVPQVYWPRGFRIADYERIVPWWAREIAASRANGHRVGLFVGEASYRAGTSTDRRWRDPNVLAGHRRFTSTIPEVQGAIYFSARHLRADRRGTTTQLVKRWYSRPALLPLVGDPGAGEPAPVAGATRDGGTVRWTSPDERATTFAVYRVPGTAVEPCDLADARYLVAAVRRTGADMSWSDARPRDGVTYVVTAVDRSGQESGGIEAR
jgi:uncharacterized lipoprotein YddW (UPF0748 family)